MLIRFILLVLSPLSLFAGTVRLINNSPYELRAVIQGSDGSNLAEMMIKTQKEMVWTDSYGQSGTRASTGSSDRSKTPYTVLWYCLGGDTYGVCDTVGNGAVVTAQGSIGPRMCNPNKKKPPAPEGARLDQ